MHISYNDWEVFKYATNDSNRWKIVTIDDDKHRKGVVEAFSAIAVDSNNNVHISYYDWGWKEDLKYATNASGRWVISTIDSTGNVGAYTSIAVDSNNNVHISYIDRSMGAVKYATDASGTWVISTIDSTGDSSGYALLPTSIAVDSNNNVHISYSNGWDLKYATNAS